MEYKSIFSFDIEWNIKTASFFLFLAAVPNLLGMINISTPLGFKIHFFQAAIFIAAAIYGPWGGLLSGLFGSVYSALIMNNPYIVGGNMILGFFAGYFFRKKINIVFCALLAFLIQLPWLIITDYYLAGLSAAFIKALIIALLISNTVWAILAHYTAPIIRNHLE